MIFEELRLNGAFLIRLEPRRDARGFFARAFCCREFEALGLDSVTAQSNLCHNASKGTLRGMHFQRAPHAETKIVRCIRGGVFDVIIDLRRGSPTFASWVGNELTQENRLALYVPRGFAHGYLTLTDDTEVLYQVSEPYHPESEGGVRWDDPALRISWPMAAPMVSAKDSNFPDFRGEAL